MRYLSLLSITTFLLLPTVVFAGYGLGETAGAAGLASYGSSLEASLGTVIGAALSLIGIVFFVLVIYGGVMWMTAAGNQDQVKKGLNTVISAAIGLIIVLSAYAITSFVLGSLNPGPSNQGAQCTALGGTCGTPSSCASPNTVQIGLCPGGTDNVCCVPPGNSTNDD